MNEKTKETYKVAWHFYPLNPSGIPTEPVKCGQLGIFLYKQLHLDEKGSWCCMKNVCVNRRTFFARKKEKPQRFFFCKVEILLILYPFSCIRLTKQDFDDMIILPKRSGTSEENGLSEAVDLVGFLYWKT